MLKTKLILLDGKSGSGKTTVAKFLGQELDFLAFEGDEIRYNVYSEHPEIAKSIFGRYPDIEEDGKTFAFRNYQPLTVEKEKLMFDLARDYIEEQIEWILNNPTTDFASHPKLHKAVLNVPSNPKGIIAETVSANKFKKLWMNADVSALIDTIPRERFAKLAQRLKQEQLTQADMIEIRGTVQDELLKDSKADLNLLYRYNQKSLNECRDKIRGIIKD